MEIRVAGHQVETGEAFRTHVAERLEAMADKYFERAIAAQVTLSNGPHDDFRCDIVCHVMQGLVLKGSNTGGQAQLAFDGAADRIEKQLRRYMRRLKDRSGRPGVAEWTAPLGMPPADAGYRILDAGGGDEAGDEGMAPLTIAETEVDIPHASVSDAVMMLDLRNTTALLFRNAATGAYNMVYRREDGHVGWVEPRD